MTLLDVADVLDDPDFHDGSLVCIRRTQTVGDDGLATIVQERIPFGGVVTVDRARRQTRDLDATRIDGAIKVHSPFTLRVAGPITDADTPIADLVVWHGQNYTVDSLDDYSDYGFVVGHCSLQPLNGAVSG